MKKVIGYLLALVGILAIASTSFNKIREISQIPEVVTTTMLLIGGGVLVAIGIFLIYKAPTTKKSQSEVPIYKGKDIVGYRQH